MTRHAAPRKYPRVARVNEVVRETLGEEIERLNDPRLGLVTITGVEVSADLRQATVYYSALGRQRGHRGSVTVQQAPEQRESTRAALVAAAPHLRAELGRQVRLKYLPRLEFREDPSMDAGDRIDAILRDLHRGERGGDDGVAQPGRDVEAEG